MHGYIVTLKQEMDKHKLYIGVDIILAVYVQ